ncbi:hypothetical protein GWI33_011497, partial [Rhynchophorus ferrugineus]
SPGPDVYLCGVMKRNAVRQGVRSVDRKGARRTSSPSRMFNELGARPRSAAVVSSILEGGGGGGGSGNDGMNK